MNFFDGFGHSIFAWLVNSVGAFLILMGTIVAVALMVIIVRYLLITTRAAQVYIDLNAPAKPLASAPTVATPAAKTTTTRPAPARSAAAKTSTPPATKSSTATKPSTRSTPKSPPPTV